MQNRRISRNRLLARLPANELALLEPHLERVALPLRKQLETRSRRIEHAYFIEDGIASVVANGTRDDSIEVGLIGAEGMTAIAVILGAERAPHATFMQVAGSGLRLPSDALRQAMEQSAVLHRTLTRYAHTFFVQTTYTALTNGRSKVEERLARWLLMAHDRIAGDELPLTHEFLAIMLGVRRSGVTTALLTLKEAELIEYRRGLIRITNREGLKKAANGAYGGPEAEFEKLFGRGV
ncbi:MAG: Crp/Fnr family transcriptional regulator [Hyphomicrobiaceae bacterium]